MAAFSYQHHHHFPVDSVFLPNTPIKMSAFSEEPNNTTPITTTTTSFSQFHPFEPPLQHHIPVDVSVHGSSNNEPSVTSKHSTYSSLISEADKLESGEQVTQKVSPMDKKRKNRDGSSLTSAQSKDARDQVKDKKQKKCSGVMIKDVFDQQKKTKADKKDQKKVPEEAPAGYIHVRARRGQATDSHSLAERVRREKISERMKHLQALVPGCDKITGKALVLDEIINYVQSLQNQVEFLSMKLSCVNPMFYDFGMDLDSFMGSSGLTTPQPNMPQCSPAQPTGFSDATTTFTTNINYPHLDTSSSLAFQQGQRPSVLSQDIGHLLWDVDDHRQESINQSTFSNNLYSFH